MENYITVESERGQTALVSLEQCGSCGVDGYRAAKEDGSVVDGSGSLIVPIIPGRVHLFHPGTIEPVGLVFCPGCIEAGHTRPNDDKELTPLEAMARIIQRVTDQNRQNNGNVTYTLTISPNADYVCIKLSRVDGSKMEISISGNQDAKFRLGASKVVSSAWKDSTEMSVDAAVAFALANN